MIRSKRLGRAIPTLIEKYDEAMKLDWIKDKEAWALYQAWRIFDEERDT